MTENQNERVIDELLPWYATGRLAPADAAQVDVALAADPALGRRLDLVRDELAETIRVNEQLGAPSPHVIERLFAKIDAEPRAIVVSPGGLTARLSEWLSRRAPRTLALATVAGLVVVLAQAGIIVAQLIGETAPTFTTASFTTADRPAGTFVLVGFADTATAGKMLEFLKANNAVIVDGPRAGGLFKLKVSAETLPREEADRIAQRLRADGALVRLAAPTQ
ncbi:hypothetical protein [Blastochloris viridis]|uniref:Putative anti-sigmaE protein n=1 Tax=Blastochloris viridis TaxID=1079 RepID=A0A0H5BBN8_BLAVI|nr:hypothetical protein [Blastochloris viridis]ALK10393.1 hypothetical protein BVIR_2628 [Blastochloris viridis]BAR99667.1 hypothetical protein BV133_2074 [Blastochloris viridis]CUU43055.1 putative anti-sigmaE protein [Blastochloris viridis]